LACWAERERIRLEKKKKKLEKGGSTEPFIEVARAMPLAFESPHFLTFVTLALPAGKHSCLEIFKLVAGSGPADKKKKGDLDICHAHIFHFQQPTSSINNLPHILLILFNIRHGSRW
jgi:hypothetical protein